LLLQNLLGLDGRRLCENSEIPADSMVLQGAIDRLSNKLQSLLDRFKSLRYCFALTLMALFVQRCCAQKFSRAT